MQGPALGKGSKGHWFYWAEGLLQVLWINHIQNQCNARLLLESN